ncbi:MAG TPA: DUF3325 domain-containing protein [Opitutaceae bacterium]
MIWLSFACCYLGLAAAGLAMNLHHRRVFQRAPSERAKRALNAIGAVLLLTSAMLSIHATSGAVGLVTTVAMTAISGLFFSGLLALAPRWIGVPALLLVLVSLT